MKNNLIMKLEKEVVTGLDPQIKAWVGHCACMVEAGLATKPCQSGKSEVCA